MLTFAIPALGIFLSSPLLSNIDNIFVGRTVGTTGLAALSPATVLTDQVLYLFSFLSRATTGIVSRAETTPEKQREAAAAPLTIAILCGVTLSLLYALLTPTALSLLGVASDAAIRPAAASYVYYRGCVTWAALTQSVCLSVLLATGDAIAPLQIVGAATLLNVVLDAAFCVWPFRGGCAGAAAATALTTVFSSGVMVRVMSEKKLLPAPSRLVSLPTRRELKGVGEYIGPLFAISITRTIGLVSMQRAAARLGVESLAAYHVCVNALGLFLLFGEPLNQLHQTRLPPLIDKGDRESVAKTLKSVMTLAAGTSVGVGMVAFLALSFGSGFFSSDAGVQLAIRNAAPAVVFAVVQVIMTITMDGAMLATKDFGFIVLVGFLCCIVEVLLVKRVNTIGAIFVTFALRRVIYASAAIVRAILGYGTLGRLLFWKGNKNYDTIRNV